MLDYYLQIFNLFELPWNSSVKVLQKDSNYMFQRFDTHVRQLNGKQDFFYINCLEYVNKDVSYYDKEITDKRFFKEFETFCKRMIDKDFILYRRRLSYTRFFSGIF